MHDGLSELPTFGRFRALERLGSGGSGVVYRAIDPETDREVAVKSLRVGTPEDDYRLKREFRALVEIVHPNLVELYDLFAGEHGCFFTMELVRGWPCTEWVQRRLASLGRERADPEGVLAAAVALLRQLHAGLSAVHAAAHVHRDVKPSNALVTPAGRLVLLDFGLAAAIGQGLADTDAGAFAGTLPYMAPEQMLGASPVPAMDWFAAGVVLYEAVVGTLPFAGSAQEQLLAKQRRTADLSLVPPALRPIVDRMLDPDPTTRADDRVVGATLAELGEPPQRFAARARAEPFVGRAREIAWLHEMLARVAPEQPAVVRISGPSGIGKTRLVEEFLTQLQGRALVFRGRCHAHETLPYKALDRIVDEISRHLLQLPEAAVHALLPRHAGALLRLFPVLGRVPAFARQAIPLGGAEPQEVRRRGLAALRDLLGKLADRDHVVLWIDDLQWGDDDSARLVAELLEPPDPPGVLLLLSYPVREGGVIAFERVRDPGAVPERSAVLELAPLPVEDGRALARELLGDDPTTEAAVAQIAADGEGSPLLLAELAEHVIAGGAPLDRELPPGARLQQLALDRAATLPVAARRILDLVAVAGGPVEQDVVLAAGGGDASHALLQLLRQRLLVRDAIVDQRRAIEAFHDRVRRALVARMPHARQVDCHRALADALRRSATAAPEAIARHLHGAGDDAKAAEYAAAAGDRAAAALAFLRAADHYADALAWRADDFAWTCAIRARRAAALVDAGRSSAAADDYLAAARASTSLQANELTRLACKQLFAAGRVDEANAVLGSLLHEIGLSDPRGGVAAFWSMLLLTTAESLHRPALPRRSRQPRAIDLFRVDVCDAAARGLIAVDSIRGVYFLFLGLRLARRAGELGRYGRSLAGVGGSVLLMGPRPLRRRGRRMLEVAEEIARQLDDPYIAGSVHAARGQVALARGEWPEALRASDAAAELDQRYLGVTFERNVARMAALRALEEMGRLSEVAERASELLRVATSAGDRYGSVTARLNLAQVKLAGGDPAGAREIAEDVLGTWSSHGFHIQHLYAHRIVIHAALYAGAVDEAWQRIDAIWGRLRRSGLLLVPVSRFDAELLRARCALAMAARDASARRTLVREVRRTVRRMSRLLRPDARPHALLLAAGMAAVRGDVARARNALDQAAALFDAAHMELAAATTRLRSELLLRPAVASGDRGALQAFGVADAPRWLRIHTPGFTEPSIAVPKTAVPSNADPAACVRTAGESSASR